MTFLKHDQFSFPSLASLFGALRGPFRRGDDDLARLEIKYPEPVQTPAPSLEQDRYARILETELDRQILTQVEREDMDMLDRVRAALYED